MTSNSTSNGQQLELVNTTKSESLSQLSQNQGEIGRKSIRKCHLCGNYDFKWNMRSDSHSHFRHAECEPISWHNRKLTNPPKGKYPKLKQHNPTTHCSITGIKFQEFGDYKPHWDHDHDTGMHRAVIPAVFNRLEGCFRSLMKETGASYHQIADWVEELHNIPGEDLKLKSYPEVGYATIEQALNETIN